MNEVAYEAVEFLAVEVSAAVLHTRISELMRLATLGHGRRPQGRLTWTLNKSSSIKSARHVCNRRRSGMSTLRLQFSVLQ